MSLRDALLDAIEESCVVALPRERNCATSEDAANDPTPDPRQWLREFLADHIVPVPSILAAAKDAGLLWNDIVLAAEDMLVRVMKSDGRTYWAMPQKRIKSSVPPGRVLTIQPAFEPPPWVQ
ncbi:hypothetical protein [Xenophilus azovorans]|uniref:hypothetical protein n=1 Tax=Xenophilus azovorans TaxID=151755 RepID=UPI00056F1A3C|nr:hypothetical protein [Xenophilus azovorans]